MQREVSAAASEEPGREQLVRAPAASPGRDAALLALARRPGAAPAVSAAALRMQRQVGNAGVARLVLARQQAPAPPAQQPAQAVGQSDDVYAEVRASAQAVTDAHGAAARRTALASHRAAVLRLAALLRDNLPPQTLLEAYLDRTDVTAAEKARTIGRLASEVARMEFLIGTLYNAAAGAAWESGGDNHGEFPEYYEHAIGGGNDPWCTMFAGYAYTRLGFRAGAGTPRRGGGTRQDRSMFLSGYRLRNWSLTGQNNEGVQVTPAAQSVHSSTTGGQIIDRDAWAALHTQLTHETDAARRQRFAADFLTGHGGLQSGDIIVKTRGTATTNDFQGASSHTMMVDRVEGTTIYTVEGNHSNAVGARRIDLTSPTDVGQIIIATRLGTEYFGAQPAAAQAPGTTPAQPQTPAAVNSPGIVGGVARFFASEAMLMYMMRYVSGQLVSIASAQHWIQSSDANATVFEWEHGSTTAAQSTASEH